MLDCKVTDTDMSFISENTAGGTNCVHHYDECRLDYQYIYNETSVIEIKALHELNCTVQRGYFCKFFVTFVLHCIISN
jgi:hypothetical protein